MAARKKKEFREARISYSKSNDMYYLEICSTNSPEWDTVIYQKAFYIKDGAVVDERPDALAVGAISEDWLFQILRVISAGYHLDDRINYYD